MQGTAYYIDLEAVSLEKLKEQLKNARLLPSQKVLGEEIDGRFARLQQHGIQNLRQLQDVLKSKSDIQLFSKATGLSVEYLTILRREINSYQPKAIKLKFALHTKRKIEHATSPQQDPTFGSLPEGIR